MINFVFTDDKGSGPHMSTNDVDEGLCREANIEPSATFSPAGNEFPTGIASASSGLRRELVHIIMIEAPLTF